MSKIKRPKWVPHGTAEMFETISFHKRFTELFGKGIKGHSLGWEIYRAAILVLDLHQAEVGCAVNQARIWNKAMDMLDYTEVYDAWPAKPGGEPCVTQHP